MQRVLQRSSKYIQPALLEKSLAFGGVVKKHKYMALIRLKTFQIAWIAEAEAFDKFKTWKLQRV